MKPYWRYKSAWEFQWFFWKLQSFYENFALGWFHMSSCNKGLTCQRLKQVQFPLPNPQPTTSSASWGSPCSICGWRTHHAHWAAQTVESKYAWEHPSHKNRWGIGGWICQLSSHELDPLHCPPQFPAGWAPFVHHGVQLINFFACSQVALVVKNLTPNARDIRDSGLIPGLRRSPGGGHGNPLQCSCLENPVDRGAWWATVHRVTESWTGLKQPCMPAHCLMSPHPSWYFLESASRQMIFYSYQLQMMDFHLDRVCSCAGSHYGVSRPWRGHEENTRQARPSGTPSMTRSQGKNLTGKAV